MYYVVGILFGLIPEVLFITLFLTFVKNIKQKRTMLFILISISYILTIFIKQYRILFYVIFIFLIFASLKITYKKKSQIIDLFVGSISFMWIAIISYICFLFLKEDLSNYYLLYAIDRIVLFIPLIFRKQLNMLYKQYCKLWNRNDKEKRPIKSITLRNISLLVVNITIFLANIYVISIINFPK